MEKLELIESQAIITYRIKVDEEKIEYLKKKLIDLGQEEELEVKYNYYLENIESATKRDKHADEFLGIIGKNYLINKEFPHSKPKTYRGMALTTKKVRIKRYPILYHILFGNYRATNPNLLKSLNLYLENKYGLKDETGNLLYQISEQGPRIKEENDFILYDESLQDIQKINLIRELLAAITFEPITREPLEDINNQIDFISRINATSKSLVIEELKIRILKAQENTDNLTFLQEKTKTISKKVRKK